MRLFDPSEAGPDGYPLEWHESIKHLVRELAGHRCVRCHHPYRRGEHGNGEWTPCDEQCDHDDRNTSLMDDGTGQIVTCARWRILTVHHLDGNKLNCRWWNLAALCQRCHLSVQARVKMPRRWMLDHSEWFKPYVAGYYAFSHLGQDLSRDDVMARLDELLELGRNPCSASA